MEAKSETVRARIEPRLKRKVDGILAGIGLSTTDAITLFYRQIELHRGLPFPLRVPNQEMRKALKEGRGGKLKTYTADELFKELDL